VRFLGARRGGTPEPEMVSAVVMIVQHHEQFLVPDEKPASP
jgi:hypothetical protein